MEFNDRLRSLRNNRKLSAAQLASEFNKSEGAIRMWETGRSKPDADTLIALANFFDCTVDYLLGVSDIKNQSERETLSSVITGSDSLYSELKEEYKIMFQETIKHILISFYALNNDERNRGKDLFMHYKDFLGYLAALYNTQFGLFAPPFFEAAPKNDEEVFGCLIIASFELKDELENLIFEIIGLDESTASKAQFQIDYEKYKKFMRDLVNDPLMVTDNNSDA